MGIIAVTYLFGYWYMLLKKNLPGYIYLLPYYLELFII